MSSESPEEQQQQQPQQRQPPAAEAPDGCDPCTHAAEKSAHASRPIDCAPGHPVSVSMIPAAAKPAVHFMTADDDLQPFQEPSPAAATAQRDHSLPAGSSNDSKITSEPIAQQPQSTVVNPSKGDLGQPRNDTPSNPEITTQQPPTATPEDNSVQADQRCIQSWFWRIHKLHDKSNQLKLQLHQHDRGLSQLKDEQQVARTHVHRWTLWQRHVQKSFIPLVEQHRVLDSDYQRVEAELKDLKLAYSRATVAPTLRLNAAEQQPIQKLVDAFVSDMWKGIRQTFIAQPPQPGPKPSGQPAGSTVPPSQPAVAAPTPVSFQTRIPICVPPGLVVYNVADMALRPIPPYSAMTDPQHESAPPRPTLRGLSDQWAAVLATLEHVARENTLDVFRYASSIDPHVFRTQRSVELANLAEHVLNWLMDPRYQAEVQHRVDSSCGTPAEAQFIKDEEDEQMPTGRLHDYAAFAANKAAKVLKDALLVIPNLQVVVVDQGRAVWNPKCMSNYHHGNPDRDPSANNPPVVMRWVWPGWRDPSTGNIVVKPAVYTGLELEVLAKNDDCVRR